MSCTHLIGRGAASGSDAAMGKVLKRALQAPFWGTLMADANCATPSSSLPDLCMSTPPASSDSSCQTGAHFHAFLSMLLAKATCSTLQCACGLEMWQ